MPVIKLQIRGSDVFVLLKLVTKLKLMYFLFILCVVTEVGTCVFYLISGLFCCLLAIKNEMNVGCRSLFRHTVKLN